RASGRDLLGAERALQDRVAALGGAHLVAPGERVALHRARRLGDHVAVHQRAVIRPELLDDRGDARLPHAHRDRPRHDIGEHERAADGAVRRAGYDAPPRNAGVRGVPIRSAFPGSDEVLARPAARGGAGLLLGCARGDPERCAQQQSWPHLSPPVRVTHNLRVCYPNTSSATSTRPNGALTCTPCTAPRTCWNISRAIATPSASAASLPRSCARRMRASTASGTDTPGTSLARNSALRSDTSGQMPATMGMRNGATRARNASSWRGSNTGWVTAKSAPASTFQA